MGPTGDISRDSDSLGSLNIPLGMAQQLSTPVGNEVTSGAQVTSGRGCNARLQGSLCSGLYDGAMCRNLVRHHCTTPNPLNKAAVAGLKKSVHTAWNESQLNNSEFITDDHENSGESSSDDESEPDSDNEARDEVEESSSDDEEYDSDEEEEVSDEEPSFDEEDFDVDFSDGADE